MSTHSATEPTRRLAGDFQKFWIGQTISNFGTSFTAFALPLLIYKMTGSAFNLALSTAAAFLPYLLFGLIIGAWVDRVNRKWLMIGVDIGNALLMASIPLMAALGILSVWWIYAVGFISSTLGIAFQAAEFAAIPNLVDQDDLVRANGRIQASYQVAMVAGPLVAGFLVALLPLQNLLLFDAVSFLISAFCLALIKISFNPEVKPQQTSTSIRQDIAEGLRYVLRHPVLRNISAMMALVNFVLSTTTTQLVLFAQERLGANETRVGLLFSAGSIGMALFALAAGPLRKRWPFSKVALGALMLEGLLTIAFSLTTWYWAALLIWGVSSGLGILFNINTGSLRQAIVPNHLLGRVLSIAGVLAWSAIPLGAFLGGLAIEWTQDVALVYRVIGVLAFLIPVVFSFTALGHAERYLPQEVTSSAGASADARA